MLPNPEKTAELWHTQQRLIGRACNAALRAEGTPEVDAHGETDKYVLLALSLREKFRYELDTMPEEQSLSATATRERMDTSDAVTNGFRVIGCLLSFGVDAYLTYCAENAVKPDAEELRSALKDPDSEARLISWFANTDNARNKVREENFSLTNQGFRLSKHCGDNAFVCRKDAITGKLSIGYDAGYFAQAMGFTASMPEIPEDVAAIKRCPAHDVFLPKLWDTMVDISCGTP